MSEQKNWRQRCTELGLDPQEVKNVSNRYDMYKRYNDEQGGDTLPLQRWYKWYRVEKLSEGHAMLAAPAQGCSIESDTSDQNNPQQQVVSEADFLNLLRLYRN